MAKVDTAVLVAVARANFSDLLDRVRMTGESFLIHRHGKPVARIVPINADVSVAEELEDADVQEVQAA